MMARTVIPGNPPPRRSPTRGEGASPVISFYPYQRRWLADTSRFKIGMFARQTGKTFCSCGEIVDDCIKAEIAGQRARWVILSRGERQAREAMDEAIKPITRAFYAVYRELKGEPAFGESDFRGDTGATYKALEVTYPGGSKITALPANADTARGFSANVLLDEFAFHKDCAPSGRHCSPSSPGPASNCASSRRQTARPTSSTS